MKSRHTNLLLLAICLPVFGCIDYFAEPPRLGPLPDGATDSAAAELDSDVTDAEADVSLQLCNPTLITPCGLATHACDTSDITCGLFRCIGDGLDGIAPTYDFFVRDLTPLLYEACANCHYSEFATPQDSVFELLPGPHGTLTINQHRQNAEEVDGFLDFENPWDSALVIWHPVGHPGHVGESMLLDAILAWIEAPRSAEVNIDGDASPCNGCPRGSEVPEGWVCVPPGTFWQGTGLDEPGAVEREGPPREVTITRPFLMKQTEVTQAEWLALLGSNPSHYEPCPHGRTESPESCPVENITWFDAIRYTNRLSMQTGFPDCYEIEECLDAGCVPTVTERPDCLGYRLPTEAEWEYAARAGTASVYWSGDAEGDLARVDWYFGNSGSHPLPVGLLDHNPWGLADIHGNVSEWTWDWLAPYDGSVTDPRGPADGDSRVVRGGAFARVATAARSAARSFQQPSQGVSFIGLRPVRTLPQ